MFSADLTPSEQELRNLLAHHPPRRHKMHSGLLVCDECTAYQGDGDGWDGAHVSWPCITVRLVWTYDPTLRFSEAEVLEAVGTAAESERYWRDYRERQRAGRRVVGEEEG